MTDAERHLWRHLRGRQVAGFKFRRQVRLGHFIADFACFDPLLVIEVDGGQHAENAADTVRTEQLEAGGFRVLRFWNNDVLSNTEGVVETIRTVLQDLTGRQQG